MARIGHCFAFEEPAGWQSWRDGARYVFHGPHGEELIVSAYVVEGEGTDEEAAELETRNFHNATDAAIHAASHPDLVVTRQLAQSTDNPFLECWTIEARTAAGGTVFLQAILRAPRGVMLVTMEGPDTEFSRSTFRGVVGGVKLAAPPGAMA